MRNRNFKGLFVLMLILAQGGVFLQGAKVAEPFEVDDLYRYGASSEFEATVQLVDASGGKCSACRVAVGENDPVDYYVTAKHCMPYFPLEQEEDMGVDSNGTNLINVKDIEYVSQEFRDFAVFTTGVKTDLPRYRLEEERWDEDQSFVGVSVGYGMNRTMDLDDEHLEERQAFDVEFKKNVEGEWDSIYMPCAEKGEGGPKGLNTPGDSGGSLLVRKNGEYFLRGVVKGMRCDYEEVGFVNGLRLLMGNLSWDGFKCWLGWNDDFRCYGTHSTWEDVDVDFVRRASKLLAKKEPLYVANDLEKKGFDVAVTYEEDYSGLYNAGRDGVVGYVSDFTTLNIRVGGRVAALVSGKGEMKYFFRHEEGGKEYEVGVELQRRKVGPGYELRIGRTEGGELRGRRV